MFIILINNHFYLYIFTGYGGSMFLKTDGLIIKENFYSEKDKIITILTRNNGLIRAFAKGCRNVKHKNFSDIQFLNYSDFTFFFKGETYTVNEAQLKMSFFYLKKDFESLILAQYFCEIIINLVKENMESENILKLTLNSIYALTNNKFNKRIVKSVFEFRLLKLLGYQPNFLECKFCKDTNINEFFFSKKDNIFICLSCIKKNTNKLNYNYKFVKINSSVLSALKHSIYSKDKNIFSFSLSNENIKAFFEITQSCLLSHINKPLKTLKIYEEWQH